MMALKLSQMSSTMSTEKHKEKSNTHLDPHRLIYLLNELCITKCWFCYVIHSCVFCWTE